MTRNELKQKLKELDEWLVYDEDKYYVYICLGSYANHIAHVSMENVGEIEIDTSKYFIEELNDLLVEFAQTPLDER